jgi:deoxyribodipyrimidine photo-lyase
MKKSIVWFKTDLRITDNETLVRAIAASDEVIPVYCLDERLLKEESMGFKRIGAFRLKFILESITDLDASLRSRGSGIIFRIGKSQEVLPELARKYGVTKVFSKKEVAIEEKRIQASVEKALWKQNCVLENFSTSTLYHALDLPFGIKDIPESFSSFRKRIEKESPIRTCLETPEQIKSPNIPTLQLPSLTELGFEEPINDSRAVYNFVGGETEALKRLEHYFFESQSLSRYKETRNELIGANYSSKFSPWLAQGCVSARFIYAQVKSYEEKYGANDSTYWLIFELIWRDFFRFMMKKHGARLFHFNGFNGLLPPGTSQESALLQSWINGTTGDAFVDANMRELRHTGFMSNRGRQNVASYLIDQLKLDWRLGAAYFEEQLIDYDVSSNWGNWAYLAGVGNDPRGKRVFNTEKQAKDYDADGQYRKLWLERIQ